MAVGVATVLSVATSVLIGLPVLSADRLGPVVAVIQESGEQVGWPRLVDTVADAWLQIPPGRRRTAVIFTSTPIALCTRQAAPWSTLWPTLRHY